MFSAENSVPDANTNAIYYRGQAHSGTKCFWRGTQRSISPSETLKRIQPHFLRCGITRLANITGLDRIGVPVTLAMRPNSRTLSNGSGKGFSLDAARVSAAMEAIELFHAEEAELPTFQTPYDQLSCARIPIENLALAKHSFFNTWWPFRWTLGWDIMNQEEVAVPWWSIHMGARPDRCRDLNTFQVSSNGLASGNNLLEAINAGVFEVIERDAVACHRLAWNHLKQLPPIVDPDTIEHALVRELIGQLAAAGVGFVLFDCTVDTNVPVHMAYIYDLRVGNMGIYRGYGAHLDPEVAMIRAITEAIQGRAIYIAGSRDDVFRHRYVRLKDPTDSIMRSSFQLLKPTVDARERLSEATPTFEGDTRLALEKLHEAGLRQAIVVDITFPDLPIKVVKVLVPGLEGYMFDFYEPGHRALDFLKRRRIEGGHLPGPLAASE